MTHSNKAKHDALRGIKIEGEGRFIVENLFCSGWENCWTDNETGSAVTFNTLEDAQNELKQYFFDCAEAVKNGDMLDYPNPTEFRIVKI